MRHYRGFFAGSSTTTFDEERDFEDVYEQACGGPCGRDDELAWANLLTAVQAASPADLGYWTDAGGFYGVDF